MRFTNFDRSYQVMRYLDGTEKTEEYLCTETTGREEASCLLVRVTEPVLAKHLLLFLEKKIKGGDFTDYVECFQADEALLAVFRYSTDESLAKRLVSEYCSLRERTEMAKGILERLLLLNPHPYFAWNGLDPERITVSRSMDIHLNYHLDSFDRLEECTMTDAAQQLQKVFLLLFAEEQKNRLCPYLDEYIQQLGMQKGWTYLKMYQEFMAIYEELLKESEEKKVPQTFWFKLWEKVKKFAGVLWKIAEVLLLVAALVYVVISIQDTMESEVTSQTMKQIGNLTIENSESLEQENGE